MDPNGMKEFDKGLAKEHFCNSFFELGLVVSEDMIL